MAPYTNRVIPRTEWRAKYDTSGIKRRLPASEGWLHHTVTVAPDLLPPFTDDYAAIREIEQITEDRFRQGMAYTRLFTPAGLIFEGHPVAEIGAHTADHNTAGIGYALVGNYDIATMTPLMINAVAWCLRYDQDEGNLRTAQLTGGHRDTKPTACPGKNAYARIALINSIARSGNYIGIHTTEEDEMADPKILAVLESIDNRLEGLQRSGFNSQKANGEHDPTHHRVSIAGVNDRLDQLVDKLDDVIERITPGA